VGGGCSTNGRIEVDVQVIGVEARRKEVARKIWTYVG
jgi:hypothetical protein